MAQVFPFSNIDECLGGTPPSPLRCIADTSYLIALVYDLDPSHEDAVQSFEFLVEKGFSFFSTVTTRAEYLERQRRIRITEALMTIRSVPQIDLDKTVRAELTNLKKWIDGQISKDRAPVPSDRELKRIRDLMLSKRTDTGVNSWTAMCQNQLRGTLSAAWDDVVNTVGISHIELGENEFQELITEKVTWAKACSIAEETGVGISDAMILNMFNCSQIPMLLSTDVDFGIAATAIKPQKVILLPDRLADRLRDLTAVAP